MHKTVIKEKGMETGEAPEAKPKREVYYVNGVSIRKGTGLTMQDLEELRDIFTGLNIDARELRRMAWAGEK